MQSNYQIEELNDEHFENCDIQHSKICTNCWAIVSNNKIRILCNVFNVSSYIFL